MNDSRWTRVTEVRSDPASGLPLVVHPGWTDRFPWLVQGTTVAGAEGFDLRVFGEDLDPNRAIDRLSSLAAALGFGPPAYARQVHGPEILRHDTVPSGSVAAEADGHLTATPGVLLAVTIADCVPVSVVDVERRAVALLHAGWRSVASGILERGLDRLSREFGTRPGDLWVHLGPSICGDCYEVGPEVFAALDRPEPPVPTPIDLRAILAERASESGVREERISISSHCTLHGDSPFYSHRGGDRGRQMGLLGVREDA